MTPEQLAAIRRRINTALVHPGPTTDAIPGFMIWLAEDCAALLTALAEAEQHAAHTEASYRVACRSLEAAANLLATTQAEVARLTAERDMLVRKLLASHADEYDRRVAELHAENTRLTAALAQVGQIVIQRKAIIDDQTIRLLMEATRREGETP